MRLKDKVCIITGGGSGIGRATALLFADEGARLVVADKRNAQAVAAECAGKGAQAIAVEAAVALANRAAYCASKGAVAALTRAIAIDHVGDGIRCNAIAPGTIDTPYFDD